MPGWWAGRVRQTWRHLTGRVSRRERAELAGWLTAAQLALFENMQRADQRHGLDVVASLREAGYHDRELLLAGLLHDCAKGPQIRLWHRIGWSLAERYGSGVRALAVRLPGYRSAFAALAEHPLHSAELALAAGCSERTAALIRGQSGPPDSEHGRALQLADRAN